MRITTMTGTRVEHEAPLGSGKRFSALKAKLAGEPGVRNPGAVAAAIGRKKYGAKGMAEMAEKGRED